MSDFAAQRLNMLESQLRPNLITNPDLLAAMGELPRELFLPKRLRGVAYVDEDIPLGGGRSLMEPLVLARLIQMAGVGKTESALDIACGPGYSTALLARLCHHVIGLESDHELALEAASRLRDLGIRNASVVEGPLAAGHVARAPYDVILLEGAVEEIPSSITDQLADNGRLVTVMRREGDVGHVTLVTKRAGVLVSRPGHDAATLPLAGFARRQQFVF